MGVSPKIRGKGVLVEIPRTSRTAAPMMVFKYTCQFFQYELGVAFWESPSKTWDLAWALLKSQNHVRVAQNLGFLLGGPHNKDYSILGSVLGYPYFGKLSYLEKECRPWMTGERTSSFHRHHSMAVISLGLLSRLYTSSVCHNIF